jgi:c-di-GMP-related signal transduction protein
VQQHSLAARYAGKGIRMLAEKVESPEEFSRAMKMGYALFQGYLFCRPEILQHRSIPSYKLAYMQLLQDVTAPNFKMEDLASKIKLEPSLTYKLLRYLNSPVFGLRTEIHSIAHALRLLGERELRKWIAIVAVGVLADGKPDELMKVPLVRGRFCELLAPYAGMADQASDLFFTWTALGDRRDPRSVRAVPPPARVIPCAGKRLLGQAERHCRRTEDDRGADFGALYRCRELVEYSAE